MPRADRLALAFEEGGLRAPETGDVLVIRAAGPSPASGLDPMRTIYEQSFRPAYDALVAAGCQVTPRATAPAAMAVVLLTRARAENLGNVARALELLPEGATLAVDGAKTDGVDSLARLVAATTPLAGQFTKAHGRTFWFAKPRETPAAVSEWAAGAAPARNADGFLTEPGLFSPDGPDPGSRRLAAHLDGRLKGRVADLGAGWGWLAREALARCPAIASIDLHEAEARALDAARVNVPDPRAAFHWVDVAKLARPEAPYDAVIANPPFHVGRKAEPERGVAFVAAAARLLKPSGRFLMVANRQLPYEAALAAGFAKVERLHEDGAYKVFCAERPRRSRPV